MSLETITLKKLPASLRPDRVYYLPAVRKRGDFYQRRTDRNIGWITPAEQNLLRSTKIAIAGCGGMGGGLPLIFARLGVGEVRIADPDRFEPSNLNRQPAATAATLGKSKVLATARAIREAIPDVGIWAYPQGVTDETAERFFAGANVACCEIEFWRVFDRLVAIETARRLGVPIFDCCSIGFGSRAHLFTPESCSAEEMLGMSLNEARALQQKIDDKTVTAEDRERIVDAMLGSFVCNSPEYCPDPSMSTIAMVRRRLIEEGTAPIIATNPPMATGFLADLVLLHVLDAFGMAKRTWQPMPLAPTGLTLDIALRGFYQHEGSRS
jgi:molybdopterin/thiamine biosynthesis adenylyltransferase